MSRSNDRVTARTDRRIDKSWRNNWIFAGEKVNLWFALAVGETHYLFNARETKRQSVYGGIFRQFSIVKFTYVFTNDRLFVFSYIFNPL